MNPSFLTLEIILCLKGGLCSVREVRGEKGRELVQGQAGWVGFHGQVVWSRSSEIELRLRGVRCPPLGRGATKEGEGLEIPCP